MEVIYPRCAGLDVHASSITACVRIAAGHEVTYQHRTVTATTAGLLDLAQLRNPVMLNGQSGNRDDRIRASRSLSERSDERDGLV